MKVLIACEESQTVCKAFRALGHEAYSCDVQEPSGGHPEWHILGDALEAVKGGDVVTMDGQRHDIGKWELLIAHPPCTYLTSSSAMCLFNADHTIKDLARERKGWEAKEFFMALLRCGVERIAVENPTPLRYFGLPSYSQIIEPYMFGDPWRKRTCLWLRGLPLLQATNMVEPKGLWVGSTSRRREADRKVQSKYTLSSNRNSKVRAKTFPGIAAAMAVQWGGDING
ncbi:MAG: DNA cytosine methyltransferase [Oscillospiraceae bacterium]|nr:DNA cytosine methyltransferase [Oscillospiraceae bacterium]